MSIKPYRAASVHFEKDIWRPRLQQCRFGFQFDLSIAWMGPMVLLLGHFARMWESTGPSKSSNMLSISKWARGDCLVLFATSWRSGFARLLAWQKLGKSRIQRKVSMLGTLLIRRSMSSFYRVVTILLISKKFDSIFLCGETKQMLISNKFH